MVVISTSMGAIVAELFTQEAPISVANFLRYVNEGYYTNTIFHRVIPSFMIQGGGMDANLAPKATHDPIVNEATNGLSNTRGTLAMARTNVINSATSQFFINVVDNISLNHTNDTETGYGYAVFGRVVEGMDVADSIVAVPTVTYVNSQGQPVYQNVPRTPITIKSMTYSTATMENDTLTGTASNDTLYGFAGNDALNGGGGNDTIIGGAGNDTIIGGTGNDRLTGGSGADAFRFNKTNEKTDRITDFSSSQKDKLTFKGSAFGNLATGNLSSTRFTANTTGIATTTTQRFILRTTNKTLYFDADGSGSNSSPIAMVTLNTSTLVAGNIAIVS